MLQLPLTDRVTEESVVEVGPHNILLEANAGLLLHAMNPAQGPRDWAQALMSILPEGAAAADPDSIACFLGDLGKGVGAGLVEAVLTTSAFAPVFVNAYGLVNASKVVMVNKENCAKASGLAQDVLRVLDISWRRFAAAHQAGVNPSLVPGAGVPEETLETLAYHLRHLLSLVAPFTAPGWLLHAACNKKLKERFDGGHNALVDCLKAAGLDVLLGGKALARGDYRDPVRAVRRLLQSHGAGSVTKGLCYYKAKADTGAVVHELVTLLDLGAADDDMVAAAVRAELAAVPTESGMDVDVYYNSLVAGENTGHDTSNDAVFDWYDKDCAGYLEMEQFQEVLSDLGLLEDRSDTDAAAYLTASFKMADKEGLGRLDRAAFCAYYSTLTASGARQQLLARMGLPTQESLRSLFHAFASFGSRTEVNDMDAARFVKMVKDAHLLCNQLSIADADIIFKRCKAKASRRISFEQFLAALLMCAEKKGSSLEAVVRQVLDAGGPVVHGVAPESVRLHDDKSTYTGVYAKGGPKAVDAPKNDLAVLLDRSDADVRGVKLAQPAKVVAQAKSKEVQAVRKPPQAPCAQPRPETIRTSASQEFVTRRRTDSSGGGVGSVGGLRDKFAAFAMFGHAPHPGHGSKLEMDGSSFAKLCRDCKLLDKKFTLTRADLIFQSVKPVGHRAIGFAEFKKALELVATEKAAEAVDIINIVCCSGGPLLSRSTRT
ncbi:p25-alpha-domain-containing protein [Haematococcus lacustris]